MTSTMVLLFHAFALAIGLAVVDAGYYDVTSMPTPAICQYGEPNPVISITPTPTGGTAIPTAHPSLAPTTARPTTGPTKVPTRGPTTLPTYGPTIQATVGPTTAGPTMGPTQIPTRGPTQIPTTGPTVGPTDVPTTGPTVGPTTVSPTTGPTVGPTTGGPTVGPTTGPTTVSPTTGPTVGPTTAGPTMGPTTGPTVGPTTVSPTTGPTVGPTTAGPTMGPTTGPTVGPTTVSPTTGPTMGPTTAGPTMGPTTGPTTVSPTVGPTVGPTTAGPSKSPTYGPTFGPTQGPTTQLPTQGPTMAPTEGPTTTCSYEAEWVSSNLPDLEHSQAPALRVLDYGRETVTFAVVQTIADRICKIYAYFFEESDSGDSSAEVCYPSENVGPGVDNIYTAVCVDNWADVKLYFYDPDAIPADQDPELPNLCNDDTDGHTLEIVYRVPCVTGRSIALCPPEPVYDCPVAPDPFATESFDDSDAGESWTSAASAVVDGALQVTATAPEASKGFRVPTNTDVVYIAFDLTVVEPLADFSDSFFVRVGAVDLKLDDALPTADTGGVPHQGAVFSSNGSRIEYSLEYDNGTIHAMVAVGPEFYSNNFLIFGVWITTQTAATVAIDNVAMTALCDDDQLV